MMFTSVLLLIAAQEIDHTEPVHRELRMHGVRELVEAPAYLIPQLTLGATHPWEASGLLNIQPRLTFGLQMTDGSGLLDPAYDWTMATYLSSLQAKPRDSRKFASVGEVEEIASRFCQPPLDPRQERIQADDSGWLVCYLRPEQHDWLERFIQLQQSTERDWMATIDSHWFTISDAALRKLKMNSSAMLLDDADQVAALLLKLTELSENRLSSPRVTAFPGQRSEISTLNQVSYVKEYKLEIVEPGSQEIADPVVDVIQEGQVMTMRVIQTGDELYGLRMSCSSAQLERPIPTRRFKLSPAHSSEVEVAMPQLRTAKVDATVLVPDHGGVLLVTSGLADGRNLAILLSLHRTEIAQDFVEPAEPSEPR